MFGPRSMFVTDRFRLTKFIKLRKSFYLCSRSRASRPLLTTKDIDNECLAIYTKAKKSRRLALFMNKNS